MKRGEYEGMTHDGHCFYGWTFRHYWLRSCIACIGFLHCNVPVYLVVWTKKAYESRA
jgi:hypothetical protein